MSGEPEAAAPHPVLKPDGTKPELLAPAGGWEQLEYAILYGSDAVYLAAERFGMRQRAGNFKTEEIPEAVAYAHDRGVEVHVTCNIVMHEDDIAALPSFFEQMEAGGVDALIIGDLGAMRLARRYAPGVDVHVSTQASVSNAEAALAWYELGARRIVIAREMSLDSIAHMHAQLPDDLELEAFVHGAMCMAYSGRCLISDFLANRSGIGGNCAQSCRWKYALVEERRPGIYIPVEEDGRGSYILNAQDMDMLSHLDDLAAAGVDSFKIEGRIKQAYYVATVVNAYRQVIDGAYPAEMERELDAVSHRPYGTGFFYGPATQTPEDIEYRRESQWTGDVESCERIDGEGMDAIAAAGAETGAATCAAAGDAEAGSGAEGTGANDGKVATCAAAEGAMTDADSRGSTDMAGSAASVDGRRPIWRSRVRVRNKFGLDDQLEAISPHRPTVAFKPLALQHIPEQDTRRLRAGEAYPVTEASRCMELYLMDTDVELHPHDILRIWRNEDETHRETVAAKAAAVEAREASKAASKARAAAAWTDARTGSGTESADVRAASGSAGPIGTDVEAGPAGDDDDGRNAGMHPDAAEDASPDGSRTDTDASSCMRSDAEAGINI